MNRLSVIVVAHNAEKTIGRCIDSILDSDADCEVVTIDNASTDKTAQILKEYGDRIRLKTLSKKCEHIAAVRNIALAEASGEYCTFLDASGYYEPGAAEKLVDLIERYDADIIKFNYSSVYENGKKIKISDGTDCFRYVQKINFRRRVYPFIINGLGLGSVFHAAFRRSVVAGMRFDEKLRTAADEDFARRHTPVRTACCLPASTSVAELPTGAPTEKRDFCALCGMIVFSRQRY